MSLDEMLAGGSDLHTIVNQVKRSVILKTLNANNGHKIKSAAALGVHRNTLLRLIAELNISVRRDGRGNNGRKRLSEMLDERDPQF